MIIIKKLKYYVFLFNLFGKNKNECKNFRHCVSACNWDPKKLIYPNKIFGRHVHSIKKETSFHVDDTKGFYYCFGCQAKGNVFSFLKEMEGLSFFDAVKALSEKAGIPLEIDDNAKNKAMSDEDQTLFNINEAASQFYAKHLFSTKGAIALSYLRDRGLSLKP